MKLLPYSGNLLARPLAGWLTANVGRDGLTVRSASEPRVWIRFQMDRHYQRFE